MKTARRRKIKRDENKPKNKSNFFKILIYIVPIFFTLFLIYRVVVLITFNVNCSSIDKDILSKDDNLIANLFVFENNEKISDVEVLIYSEDQENILRINIPTWIYTQNEDADDVPLSALSNVGEFVEYGSGKEYTFEYISNMLGIKFDNYVWLVDSSENLDTFLNDLSVWNILFDFKYNNELSGNVYSNLPVLNLITQTNLLSAISDTYKYNQIEIVNCCLEETVISGEETRKYFDEDGFDTQFSLYIDELTSKEVEKERVNVEVYNASNVSGLASEYARKISHTGCRILRYDNSPSVLESTYIYVSESSEFANSLELVSDVVGDRAEIIYEKPSFITTGDIVVVLGTDIVE